MLPTSHIELDWIAAFQADGSLKELMVWFSYLGAQALPFLLAFVYFVLSKKQGQRLYLLFTSSGALLHCFKFAFHLPRPFWVDPRIKPLTGSGGYGLPSGHVLAATIAWLYFAKGVGKGWLWVLCLACVLLVSISRIYLGVHFISDVVAAWVIGAGLIWCFARVERKVRRFELSFWAQIAAAVWATLALLALGLGARWVNNGTVDPVEWRAFSTNALDLSGLFRSTGEFFGTAIGLIICSRWVEFELSPAWWKRFAGFAYALAGAWLIRQLRGMLPTPPNDSLRLLEQFVAGGVENFWLLWVAPWILLHINLIALRPDSSLALCKSELEMHNKS